MIKKKSSVFPFKLDRMQVFLDRKALIVDLIVCITISLVISSKFALHPIYSKLPSTDSSVFLYIGKMMHNGLVPYLDLFDHKGIMLFFIEYLGIAITPGSFIGVWILELINIFVTVWFMKKTAELFTDKKILTYMAMALSFFCCYIVFEGGNLTEEYALPWIAIALFVFLKYFKSNEYKFYEMVLLGIGFSVVLLLRVNMISVWLLFIPIILVVFIVKREWKNIGVCIFGFLLGVIAVCIPTLIYLVKTGSLNDMIDCYIKFNLEYSDHSPTLLSIKDILFFYLKNINLACLAALVALISQRKNKIYWLGILSIIAALPFIIMSGRYYYHYAIILIPLLVVPFVCALVSIDTVLDDRYKLHRVTNVSIVLLCICSLLLSVFYDNRNYKPEELKDGYTAYLEEYTSEDDDVVILGNKVKYYLYTNRSSDFKYFYQDPPIEVSDAVFEDVSSQMIENTPDCVMILWDRQNALNSQGNMGDIFRQLEEMKEDGVFTCRDFGYFYCYEKIN